MLGLSCMRYCHVLTFVETLLKWCRVVKELAMRWLRVQVFTGFNFKMSTWDGRYTRFFICKSNRNKTEYVQFEVTVIWIRIHSETWHVCQRGPLSKGNLNNYTRKRRKIIAFTSIMLRYDVRHYYHAPNYFKVAVVQGSNYWTVLNQWGVVLLCTFDQDDWCRVQSGNRAHELL